MYLLLLLLPFTTESNIVKLNINTEGYAVYLNATSSRVVNITGGPHRLIRYRDTTEVFIDSKVSGFFSMIGIPLKTLTIRVPEGSVVYLNAKVSGGRFEVNLSNLKLTRLNLISSRSHSIIKFGNQKGYPLSGHISVSLGYIEIIDLGLTRIVNLNVSLYMSTGRITFDGNTGTIRGNMTISGVLSKVDINTSKTDISVTKHGLIRVEGYKESTGTKKFQINLFGTISLYRFKKNRLKP